MDFEKNVPEWNATGTEPPSALKESGFTEGYKPPAAYFNWFWNRVSACLTEIRTKLSGHADNTSNPHGVTKAQIGLGNVDNTKDSAKSVSYANSAGTASEVSSNLAIQLNGGTTEGTDKFTYNGAAAKTVNVTPEKIGAAKGDLSNVAAAVFRDKASDAGVGIPVVAASSTDGIAYTATAAGISELYNGLMLVIIPNINSASTATTFNLNGLGAKSIRQPLSFNTAAMTLPKLTTFLVAGRPVLLQYDANYAAGGMWKTMDKQKTSAQDLYGTVPIENGGTGAETAAAARENLGITPANIGAAAASHGTHVTYGSTAAALGSSAAAGSAASVSRSDHVHPYPALTNCTGTLTVAKGGTGATTAAAALTNLGLTATATELNYMDGVTSSVQTQLNNKLGSTATAAAATKLANARTIRTNLGSTSTASFNGTANVTPGVTGTLGIGNGGTGATTAKAARENLGIIASATQPSAPVAGMIWLELES